MIFIPHAQCVLVGFSSAQFRGRISSISNSEGCFAALMVYSVLYMQEEEVSGKAVEKFGDDVMLDFWKATDYLQRVGDSAEL